MLPEEYMYTRWCDLPEDVRALLEAIPLEQPQPTSAEEEPHFWQAEEVILIPDIVFPVGGNR